MPRYSENSIQGALNDINQGISQRQASLRWGVPRSTLQLRLGDGLSHSDASIASMKLSRDQEDALIGWILEMDREGRSPSALFIAKMALILLPQDRRSEGLGRHWVHRFIQRHPEVGSIQSRRLDRQRFDGLSTQNIDDFFETYEALMSAHDYFPHNVWNMDETGIAIGEGIEGIVYGSSEKHTTFVRSDESREWVTILHAISAMGNSLTPAVIYTGKSLQAQWFNDCDDIPDWQYTYSSNGWISTDIAVRWLRDIFIPRTQPVDPDEQRLLILDGHIAHDNVEFMWLAYCNKISLLFLPAHCSHGLQPLDVAVFAPLKRYYRSLATSLSIEYCSIPFKKSTFLSLYIEAYTKSFTISNIQSGFSATGIYPLDPSRPQPTIAPLSERPTTPPTAGNWLDPTIIATPVTSLVARESLAAITPLRSSQRLLFRKLTRRLDVQSVEVATLTQRVHALEAEITSLRPKPRKKVRLGPNERFGNIVQIKEAMDRALEVERQRDQVQRRNQVILDPAKASESIRSIPQEALEHSFLLELVVPE